MEISKILVLSVSAVLCVAGATWTFFSYFPRKVFFYERLKSQKKLQYQLQSVNLEGAATIKAVLVNKNKSFSFKLTFVNDEIMHFEVNDPVTRRYKIRDVIVLRRTRTEMEFTEERKHLIIYWNDLKISIDCEDFLVDIHRSGTHILRISSLIFEEQEPNIAANFFFPEASNSYGFPQHAAPFSLPSTKKKLYRFYNTDSFAYSSSDPFQSLYGAVPLLYAHNPQTKEATGLLWFNASETYADLSHESGTSATFYSESGALDFFIFTGPTLRECVVQNTQLTGGVPLPPLFALGYHQSRFSYMTREEVADVSDEFDANDLPLDSVWLHIDYTDEAKYFTWNPSTFPEPRVLLDHLRGKNRKAVAVINPHIKVDPDYSIYQQLETYFVKNEDGSNFVAECWPGASSWIDFLNPEARKTYSNLLTQFAGNTNLHIWTDMNEPALFESEENSMPKNVVHFGDWPHRDVHNLYGFYQTMATFQAMQKRSVRPFVLTRSHFIGSQRFAAVWTGDNVATWDHLRVSVPMCLTASLSGFSLCGADIGGFVGHPSDELLQRWYQLGAWLPLFRGHSNRNVPRREPYLYSREIQNRIRRCLQQRYRHLLHWYTLFWDHYMSSEPVIRPLCYHYDAVDDLGQFLVGSDILVCPITEENLSELTIYFPGKDDVWYRLQLPEVEVFQGNAYWTLQVNLDTIPVFYRGGSIVPIVENDSRCSAEVRTSPITLYIFCDQKKHSSGGLYMDDGESFSYKVKNNIYMRFEFENDCLTNFHIDEGHYAEPIIVNTVVVFGYRKNVRDIVVSIGGRNSDGIVEQTDTFLRIKHLNLNVVEKCSITLLQ